MVIKRFSGICIAGELIGISLNSGKAETVSHNEDSISPCTITGWACREGPGGQHLEHDQQFACASIKVNSTLCCIGKSIASMSR